MRWRILVSAPYMLPFPEDCRSRLMAEGIEIIEANVSERLDEDDLMALVQSIDGVICGDDRFTERVLRHANCLKVISKWGTGIDSIDLEVAKELRIRICNTPNAFSEPVADTTLGYILAFARNLVRMDRDVRSGKWLKPKTAALNECTLGIMGVGNVGRAVARRGVAFGMRLIGCDPVTPPAGFVRDTGIEMMPLFSLLERSDFVSLHCDLNQTSIHLIAHKELAAMRPTAYLINTARGPIVNETALVEALRTQRIAGAALDVFDLEPLPANSPLRQMNNCMLAPHNSNSSPAAHERVHWSSIENLIKGLHENS